MALEQKSSIVDTIPTCEGLSMLTSAQRAAVSRYLNHNKGEFELYRFDGDMVDVMKEIFDGCGPVISTLDASLQDQRCSKEFYHPDQMLESLNAYFDSEPSNAMWKVNERVAIALVKESMKVTKLQKAKVDCPEDLRNLFTNLKASPGVIKIGGTKEDSLEETFQVSRRMISLIHDHVDASKIQLPCMTFHRGQIGGFDSVDGYDPTKLKLKDRLIWGEDAATVAIEAPFARPLIEHTSEKWFNYAGGKSPDKLRKNIEFSKMDKFFWTSIDFSRFDQTIPSWLIHQAFAIIKEFFDGEDEQLELDWIEYNFIHTMLAYPGKGIFQKHRGIPSGSHFTQLIGSICNMLMVISYVASLQDGQFQDKMDYVRRVVGDRNDNHLLHMFVMGDDNLVFTTQKLDFEDLSAYVHVNFGVKIHPTKCESGDTYSYPSFLKRIWRRNGEWQDPGYLVVNVSHPEHRRSYDTYSPWHIVYGLFLTYRFAFPPQWTERKFIEKLEEYGGIERLADIPHRDLPGVFRPFGNKAVDVMVQRAKHLLSVS